MPNSPYYDGVWTTPGQNGAKQISYPLQAQKEYYAREIAREVMSVAASYAPIIRANISAANQLRYSDDLTQLPWNSPAYTTLTVMITASTIYTIPAGMTLMNATIIGGGGGGGFGAGGGGGAGGLLVQNSISVVGGQQIAITIGAGGAGSALGNGVSGGNSSLAGYVAVGGGGGGGGGSGTQVFTANGNFIPGAGVTSVHVLVVAGGGGGGSYGGGGGAGGVVATYDIGGSSYVVTPGVTIAVTVGAGGAGGTTGSGNGSIGGNSAFGTITATGGGSGGGNFIAGTLAGGNGGSGGGGGPSSVAGGAGGTGSQGSNGGTGGTGGSSPAGAGGGGYGSVGGAGSGSTNGGNGGTGYTSSISGSSTNYAGGGGGGAQALGGSGGTASYGGGAGGSSGVGTNGTANTGGGGGGGGYNGGGQTAGTGGSGIVIVSWSSSTGANGIAGGSGGGGQGVGSGSTTGGAGTASQGNAGGGAANTSFLCGAGGGGSGGAGGNQVTSTGGSGGSGTTIAGTLYAAGGGGGVGTGNTAGSAGGTGAGAGAVGASTGGAATANTGSGGGGGGGTGTGGNGGSGIVILFLSNAGGYPPTAVTMAYSATTDPEGLLTACALTETAANSEHACSQSTGSLATGSAALAGFMQYNGRQYGCLALIDFGNNTIAQASFDLVNGVVGTVSAGAAVIKKIDQNWYWVSISGTVISAGAGVALVGLSNSTTPFASYLGVVGTGIYTDRITCCGGFLTGFPAIQTTAVTRSVVCPPVDVDPDGNTYDPLCFLTGESAPQTGSLQKGIADWVRTYDRVPAQQVVPTSYAFTAPSYQSATASAVLVSNSGTLNANAAGNYAYAQGIPTTSPITSATAFINSPLINGYYDIAYQIGSVTFSTSGSTNVLNSFTCSYAFVPGDVVLLNYLGQIYFGVVVTVSGGTIYGLFAPQTDVTTLMIVNPGYCRRSTVNKTDYGQVVGLRGQVIQDYYLPGFTAGVNYFTDIPAQSPYTDAGYLAAYAVPAQTTSQTISSTGSFTVPAGIRELILTITPGATASAVGNTVFGPYTAVGGGAAVSVAAFVVQPGQVIPCVIGTGGGGQVAISWTYQGWFNVLSDGLKYWKGAILQRSYTQALLADVRPISTKVTITASGTWTVPAGIYQVRRAVLVGAGGGGGSTSGGGGGGGGIMFLDNVSVNPGDVWTIVIGAGGVPSNSSGISAAVGGSTTITLPSGAVWTAGGGGGGGSNSGGTAGTTGGAGSSAGGSGATNGAAIGSGGGPGGGTSGGGASVASNAAGSTGAPGYTAGGGAGGASGSVGGLSVLFGNGGLGGAGANPGMSGGANTGAGGGGGGSTSNTTGGTGGSGVVLILY